MAWASWLLLRVGLPKGSGRSLTKAMRYELTNLEDAGMEPAPWNRSSCFIGGLLSDDGRGQNDKRAIAKATALESTPHGGGGINPVFELSRPGRCLVPKAINLAGSKCPTMIEGIGQVVEIHKTRTYKSIKYGPGQSLGVVGLAFFRVLGNRWCWVNPVGEHWGGATQIA